MQTVGEDSTKYNIIHQSSHRFRAPVFLNADVNDVLRFCSIFRLALLGKRHLAKPKKHI